MPVPDSYSRRYGREETTYTSSYTSRGTRSSYLSTYSTSKQSTTLPPRPPSLYGSDTYRKYGDPSTSVTSRFLSSASTSSRLRDYGASTSSSGGGGAYRTSVSPVRATTSGLRTSFADRLKAMDIDGKDDDSPLRTYTSRYTSLRNRDSPTSISGSRTYTSAYARDRSNSREYGVSPLAAGGSTSAYVNSHRERDASLTRTSTENLKKRGSPSPSSSTKAGSRKDSAVEVVANGQSSSEVIKTSSSSSSSTSESATCASKGVATLVAATSTTTTTKKPMVTTTSCTITTSVSDTTTDNSVIVSSNNTVDGGDDVDAVVAATTVNVSDSSRAYIQCARDFENNDLEGSTDHGSTSDANCTSPESDVTVINHVAPVEGSPPNSNKNSMKSSLGIAMVNNGNSSDDDNNDGGGNNKDSNNSVVVMVVQDRNNKKVKSVPSSTSALKDSVIGGVSGATSCSTVVVEASSGGEQTSVRSSPANSSPPPITSASDSVFSASSATANKVMEKDSNGNPICTDTKTMASSRSSPPTRSSGTSNGTNSVTRESKSKSPSPLYSKGLVHSDASTTVGNHGLSGTSKHLNNTEASENVNGFEMGPHTSKFSSAPSHLGENSTSVGSNRNDRKNRHVYLTGASSAITSDSSDNDSDAFSSSPQLGGRFRSREGHERAGLTGLRNIGNTCFMNTVLQCLSNTKPLLEYVIRDNYAQDINTTTSAMKGSLTRAFAEVIQELWREQRVVDTSAFKDQIQKFAPRFMGYSQQDAQEFLRYLLEGLHEDVNRVTAKPTPILTDIDDSLSDSQKAAEAWKRYLRYEDSRIVDIFVGQLRSTLKCTVCGNCSVTFDPFWDLSLPIPARTASTRLAQCFELFTKEEVLDGDEKPTCSKCQCRRKCTKSFSIQKFPRILVIHLKRFSPTERYRGKLSTLVDCPINSLDLSPYAANRGQALTYNLYGVANHSGSTYSGHYIAYCKHPYSGEWHSYNDSRVSPISTHQVISTEGYVLFYEQSTLSS